MGLDMYLKGHKFLWQDWEHPDRDRVEDGYRVEAIDLRLGYWRKHPNLHGYIINEYADGRDDCQDIELSADAIRDIMQAVTENRLPHTEGFFFGKSDQDDEQRKCDLEILEGALSWLQAQEDQSSVEPDEVIQAVGATLHVYQTKREWPKESRSVIYHASW